jgi:hypothetical protein
MPGFPIVAMHQEKIFRGTTNLAMRLIIYQAARPVMSAAMPDNTEMLRIEALVGSGRPFPSNYLIMQKRQTFDERGFREVAFFQRGGTRRAHRDCRWRNRYMGRGDQGHLQVWHFGKEQESLCIANPSGDVAYEDVWIYLVFGSSDLTDMCHEHMHTSNNA